MLNGERVVCGPSNAAFTNSISAGKFVHELRTLRGKQAEGRMNKQRFRHPINNSLTYLEARVRTINFFMVAVKEHYRSLLLRYFWMSKTNKWNSKTWKFTSTSHSRKSFKNGIPRWIIHSYHPKETQSIPAEFFPGWRRFDTAQILKFGHCKSHTTFALTAKFSVRFLKPVIQFLEKSKT